MKNLKLLLGGVAIGAIIMAAFTGIGRKQPSGEPEFTKSDTTIVHDTIKGEIKLKDRWNNRTDTDTVYSIDSIPVVVEIPIESKVYGDSSYTAIVSGYKATLDKIEIYAKTTTIEKKIYYPKMYNPRWSIGVVGGYGATKDGLSPFVGVGITYNIISF